MTEKCIFLSESKLSASLLIRHSV